jgi:rsbT co-antagonist protein RsbR
LSVVFEVSANVRWGFRMNDARNADSDKSPRELQQELEQERARRQECESLLEIVMNGNPDAIAVSDAQGNLTFNPVAEEILGQGPSSESTEEWTDKYGLFLPDQKTPYPTEELPLVRALNGEYAKDVPIWCTSPARPDGVWLSVSAKPLSGGGAVAVFRDDTHRRKLADDLEQRNAELAERQKENADLIDRLRVAVKELSTPVLEVWDDILTLPVIGVVDSQRAAQMSERVLHEVSRTQCRFVIIDVTGVEVMDTRTADHFVKIARSVELLGSRCIITGLQPSVAQALVDLGVDFAQLHTERNLKQALEIALSRTGATARRLAG